MKLAFIAELAVMASLLAVVEPAAAAVGWPEHPGAYLGVQIEQVSQQKASDLKLSEASGALITYVDQDGPACKAGLKSNDVIIAFNGSQVQNPEQLSELIHSAAAGKPAKVTVVRDGQKKDIDVTLGSWPHVVVHAQNLPPVPYMAFAPPNVKVPDIDVPSFTMLASRHGVVVESLCPQLSDYFGVPRGQGVLVRSVEKGSPGEAAGLKAGDVITKVNNETVHDMADWRRAMHTRTGKIQVLVVREKHEQTVVLNLPESRDTSGLQEQDWPGFEEHMQALQQEIAKLAPEIARSQTELLANVRPSEQELQQMRQDIERSMKLKQKDIEKMQKDVQKEVQKSIPSQQELQKQIEESMKLKQKELEKMKVDLKAFMLSPEEMEQIRRDVDESMKGLTPQLQQEMEQFRKQMEEQKLNLQEMLKGHENEQEF